MPPHSFSFSFSLQSPERENWVWGGAGRTVSLQERPPPQRSEDLLRRTVGLHHGDEALPGSAAFQGYKLLSMCFCLQCQRRTCVSNLLSILGETLRKPFVWGGSLLILHRNSGSWIYGKCGVNLEQHWHALTLQPEENTNNSRRTIRTFVYFLPQHVTDLYVQSLLSPSFFLHHSLSFTQPLIHLLTHLLTLSFCICPRPHIFFFPSSVWHYLFNEVLTFELWEMDHFPLIDASFLAQSCHVKWGGHIRSQVLPCVRVLFQTSDVLFVIWQWRGVQRQLLKPCFTVATWDWRCVEKPRQVTTWKESKFLTFFLVTVSAQGSKEETCYLTVPSRIT